MGDIGGITTRNRVSLTGGDIMGMTAITDMVGATVMVMGGMAFIRAVNSVRRISNSSC
jgi:hypothetical protein